MILFLLVIALIVYAILGWLLHIVLLAFGVALSIWICVAIIVLVSWLLKR